MVQTNETTTTKKPDFNKANIKKAIAQGKELIKSGKSKADVSREIYDLVKDEGKEVILHVFQQGAILCHLGQQQAAEAHLTDARRLCSDENLPNAQSLIESVERWCSSDPGHS